MPQTGEDRPAWCLILGVSSGIGAACARAFAAAGYGVAGVHLDRRATIQQAHTLEAELRDLGVPTRFFNVNAAADDRRAEVVASLLADGVRVRVLVHSLAFGTLRPLVAVGGGPPPVTRRQLEMTLDVMANSLVYWTSDLVQNAIFVRGGRVFALTSSGSRQAWADYGPVSAAKAALEAYVRQLALELAPYEITANAIQAGVTHTPALAKIPNHEALVHKAKSRNPHGRLTLPDDVASCLVDLARPGTHWLNGDTIRIDGGEDACA